MTDKKQRPPYSPEVRERAVRMVTCPINFEPKSHCKATGCLGPGRHRSSSPMTGKVASVQSFGCLFAARLEFAEDGRSGDPGECLKWTQFLTQEIHSKRPANASSPDT